MATPEVVRKSHNIKALPSNDQSARPTKFQGLTSRSSKQVSDWKNARWNWKDAVCRDVDLSDGAKLLAVRLVDSFAHHETAFCNPAVDTMADALGKSGRSVQRALSELQKAGWLKLEYAKGRGRTSKITFLCGPNPAALSAPEKVTRLAARHADQPETPAESPPEKVTAASPIDAGRVTNTAAKGDSGVTPILKPKNNQKERGTDRDALERPSPHLAQVAHHGSDRETEYDAMLSKRGLPPLSVIGVKSSDAEGAGFDVPFRRLPTKEDQVAVSIVKKWIDWMLAKHEARHDH